MERGKVFAGLAGVEGVRVVGIGRVWVDARGDLDALLFSKSTSVAFRGWTLLSKLLPNIDRPLALATAVLEVSGLEGVEIAPNECIVCRACRALTRLVSGVARGVMDVKLVGRLHGVSGILLVLSPKERLS